MILASMSGMLIAVTLVRETPKAFIVKPRDAVNEIRVAKDNDKRKLFDTVSEAYAWLGVEE
ncbi:hypothetical protein D3C85_1578210 [compost metagenome]